MSRKEKLRKKILQKRLKLENHGSLSESICRRIFSWKRFKEVRKVLSFSPVQGEVDVSRVNVYAGGKKELYLPAVLPLRDKPHTNPFGMLRGEEKGAALKIRAVRYYQTDKLVSGLFNIPVPPANNPEINMEEIDLVFVPGIVFDGLGWRIGFGGGFYDDFLKDCGAVKAGLCFQMQVVENVPHDFRDVRMDFIITEDGILQAVSGKQ